MNRQEMVEIIAEALLLDTRVYGDDRKEREECREVTEGERLQMAHAALKAAVKAGMLPPAYVPSFVDENGFMKDQDQILIDQPDSGLPYGVYHRSEKDPKIFYRVGREVYDWEK